MLQPTERLALVTWMSRLSQQTFAAFLLTVTGAKLSEFSSVANAMPAVTVDFIGWLEANPQHGATVCQAVAVQYPAIDEAPVLAAAAARLTALRDRAATAGPPEQARLANGIPIVNRARLREHLRAAMDGAPVKVVKVRGEAGLGRSHSWFLIRHVAASGIANPVKVDLVSPTLDNQTVQFLFDHLVRVLKLGEGEAPTSDGVTADTLAARYADEFTLRVAAAAPAWPKPLWLAFDNLDRNLRPEVKRFVSLVARSRLDDAFDNCVVFLLGTDAATEPDDPYSLTRIDTVSTFLDQEIADAVTCLNGLGATRLADDDLKARIADMQGLITTLKGRALCAEVASRLVALRQEVGA